MTDDGDPLEVTSQETVVSTVTPLKVTPEAARAFRAAIDKRGIDGTRIRLGVRGGGCSGYSYVIEFDDSRKRRDSDLNWTQDGVEFVIDPKSAVLLRETTLTHSKTLMKQGFEFKNPLEASRCGCGTSFTVKQ